MATTIAAQGGFSIFPGSYGAAASAAAPCCVSDPEIPHADVSYLHGSGRRAVGCPQFLAVDAIVNATLPYTLALAAKGYRKVLLDDAGLLAGLNIHRGAVTCEAVAKALGHGYTPATKVLG